MSSIRIKCAPGANGRVNPADFTFTARSKRGEEADIPGVVAFRLEAGVNPETGEVGCLLSLKILAPHVDVEVPAMQALIEGGVEMPSDAKQAIEDLRAENLGLRHEGTRTVDALQEARLKLADSEQAFQEQAGVIVELEAKVRELEATLAAATAPSAPATEAMATDTGKSTGNGKRRG
jgi:hypothetical protein